VPEAPALEEQLRRLKNTVMGAGHRLSLLAGAGVSAKTAAELAAISRELAEAAQRLDRLLAGLRGDG
jgi:copper homeostasis protein CutC